MSQDGRVVNGLCEHGNHSRYSVIYDLSSMTCHLATVATSMCTAFTSHLTTPQDRCTVPSRFTPPVSPTPIRSRRHRLGIAQSSMLAGRMTAHIGNIYIYTENSKHAYPFRNAHSGRLHSMLCKLCSSPFIYNDNYRDIHPLP